MSSQRSNPELDRSYNEDLRRFIRQSKVRRAAEIAAKAMDGREAAALKDSEEKNKARAEKDKPARS